MICSKKIKKTLKRKKIHPLIKMARSMLVNIILICAMVVVTVYTTFNKVANNFDTVILENNLGVVPEEELQQFEASNEILNIALFGIDSTDTSSGRSDSLIVATLDPIHNKVKLTYFMKDAYVYIDDYGYDKLKHAYTYGGPSLAINTLNTNFGLNTMLKLTKKMTEMNLNEISIQREIFPLKNYYKSQIIDGTYYITFDAATTKAQVMNYIFNDKISQ